jgi:hypothetical protein
MLLGLKSDETLKITVNKAAINTAASTVVGFDDSILHEAKNQTMTTAVLLHCRKNK